MFTNFINANWPYRILLEQQYDKFINYDFINIINLKKQYIPGGLAQMQTQGFKR